MQRIHYIFHLTAYYIAWTLGIILAAHGYSWCATASIIFLTALQILWQQYIMRDTKNLLGLIILLVLLGTAVDTILMRTGYVFFKANPFAPYISPPWMISLWFSFAVILFATLKRLLTRYYLLAFLSLLGFSFAYFIGVYMGAAYFPHGYLTAIEIGAIWALLLPTAMYFYNMLA